MSSILEEPSVRRAVFPVSVEFYHELGRQGLIDRSVELLEGVIVQKMSKSPLHASMVRRLARMIEAVLKPGQLLLREDPLTIGRSEPEPDLAVVEGREEEFFQHHPGSALWVLEVTISSADLDRRKAEIYASGGVREYWLVEPEVRRITVFRRPENGRYGFQQSFEGSGTLVCEAVPEFRLNLDEVFVP